MKRFLTLLKIEGKLSLRCPDSIFFGVCMPMGVMFLIGMIAGGKPAFEGATYTFLQSSFGALITVGICATAFMGMPLTVADYRDKKILKHFFVTPVKPIVLLLVQTILDIALAIVSAIMVTAVAVGIFGYRMEGNLLKFIGAYFLVMLSMYSIGMFMASVCKTIKIANVVCTVVYFPMLFLSGATIPYELFPKGMQQVASILPLTQGIKLLKGFSLGTPVGSLTIPITVMLVTTVLGIVGSVATFQWD